MDVLRQPRLGDLPLAAKLLLTLFLLLIGGGYLAALGNLYERHELADERAGLTLNDLKAAFHGIPRTSDPPATRPTANGSSEPARSRMLEMVEPGGPMRKELVKGGEPAVRSLVYWLRAGAPEDLFEVGSLPEEGNPSPANVIARQCLRCHNAENGEKQDTPYGPDLFEVDFAMVYKYAAPGTASPERPGGPGSTGKHGDQTLGPQSLPHLLLVTHVHMLAIPTYTVILGGLFLCTGWPKAIRGPVAVLPMAALVFEFSGWWLARRSEPLIYMIVGAGAAYGAGIAVQLVGILFSMWSSPRRTQ